MNTYSNYYSHNETSGHRIRIAFILTLSIILLLSAAVVLPEAHADVKRSKSKYTLIVKNLNNNTVVKRGGEYQIKASAQSNNNGKIKRAEVRYSSSDKKIATVSSKGVIKGKRKGNVRITVSCKGKKKTYKIKVGTPVSSISISGHHYLRKGRQTEYKAHVNSGATDKGLMWSSSDTNVAEVDSSGQVTAVGYGTANIYAEAVDGSGTRGTIIVVVNQYTAADVRWIAHRGLHTSCTENTAQAFMAAGQAGGFWGCECDIWETKHESIQLTQNEPEDAADVQLENSEETQSVQAEESSESPEYEDSFDLVINHDNTFKKTMGLNRAVKDMTASEIRAQLPDVCFFGEYLDICKQYDMVPVVEFKDSQMSDEAINKAIEMLKERGQLEDALLISFYPAILEKAKTCADDKLDGKTSYTAFLTLDKDLSKALSISKQKGFSCISSYYGHVDIKAYEKCKAEGLGVGTWTYGDSLYSDEMLYTHVMSGKYKLDFATVDYKPW